MYELAIVGTFYDGYYDLWEDFLELFSKNWPECPYPLYIVNDSKELNFKKEYNVTVLHAGEKAEYSQRVQTALKAINAKYYLLLLEDFFLGEKLDANVLNNIMKFVEEKQVKYYRMQIGAFTPLGKRKTVAKIKPSMEYTITCQPSIWRGDFLRRCIGNDVFNAWVFEGVYSKASFAHSETFLNGLYVDYRNVLCIYHGVLQGQFINKTADHFAKYGYQFNAKMPLMDKKTEMKHNIRKLMKGIVPQPVQKIIKEKMKTKSVVERYDEEINLLIDKMKLNN